MSASSNWLSKVTQYLKLRLSVCEVKIFRRCSRSSHGQVSQLFCARANMRSLFLLKPLSILTCLKTSKSFLVKSACGVKWFISPYTYWRAAQSPGKHSTTITLNLSLDSPDICVLDSLMEFEMFFKLQKMVSPALMSTFCLEWCRSLCPNLLYLPNTGCKFWWVFQYVAGAKFCWKAKYERSFAKLMRSLPSVTAMGHNK